MTERSSVASHDTASPRRTAGRPGRPQGGPPLLVPALVYGALLVAAVAVAAGDPRTGSSGQAALHYARTHSGRLHLAALLIFGAAVPLAVWTATAYRRLRTLGVTAPGAVIGLIGGVLAAGSLALSGLITWTEAESARQADAPVARLLVDLAFATGAAGFVVPLGLLVAGVGVPALILRLLPRPLAWAGLVIAVAALGSTFTLVSSALNPTLPIGRFGGAVWIVAASVLLPTSRHRIPAASDR